MNVSRFNFNLISQKDLRKYLTKKMESFNWEFSSAFDADLAHYTYNNKMSYGFFHGRNMKITIKKILYDLDCGFVLPFIYFNAKNMESVLNENHSFFDDSIYYFKLIDKRKDNTDYLIKNKEHLKKIVKSKYKKSNSIFCLEKSSKIMSTFNNELFDLRAYVLVCKINNDFYTFLYPSIFAYFDDISLDKHSFFKSIGIGKSDEVSFNNSLMKKIYNVANQTALIISNYLDVTKKIFKLEKDLKNIINDNIELQYNLYGLDLYLNAEKNPILYDISINPMLGLLNQPQKIIREKIRIYDDILENFVLSYNNKGDIDVEKSSFVLLKNDIPDARCNWFISKKINYNNDDTIEYKINSSEIISAHAENMIQNLLIENKKELKEYNSNLRECKKYRTNEASGYIEPKANYLQNGIEEFYIKDYNEAEIEHKINELLEKEKKSSKLVNLASVSIPLFGLAYIAKKTYSKLEGKKIINL